MPYRDHDCAEPWRSPSIQVERDLHGRRIITPVSDTMEITCHLALLAIGFDGVKDMPLLDALGLAVNRRGTRCRAVRTGRPPRPVYSSVATRAGARR